MRVHATLRYLHMSHRKVRLVADAVRGLNVDAAEARLAAITRRASDPVLKLLRSAVANAEANFKIKPENLYVEAIAADVAPPLKRWMPRAFGRAASIRKRSSHVTIVLNERIPTAVSSTVAKTAALPAPVVLTDRPEHTVEKTHTKNASADETMPEAEIHAPEASAPGRVAPRGGVRGRAKGFVKRIFSRKTG